MSCEVRTIRARQYGGRVDRHRLWRHVRRDWLACKNRAPDGSAPVVEVYLSGRDEPVVLGFVETSRDPDYPYVRLEVENELDDRPEGALDQRDRWIHVHESYITRVEVAFRKQSPGGAPLGFGHRIADEPAETDE
jgi:hypothetical protein